MTGINFGLVKDKTYCALFLSDFSLVNPKFTPLRFPWLMIVSTDFGYMYIGFEAPSAYLSEAFESYRDRP